MVSLRIQLLALEPCCTSRRVACGSPRNPQRGVEASAESVEAACQHGGILQRHAGARTPCRASSDGRRRRAAPRVRAASVGSGSRSKMPHLYTSGAAASTARTSGWKCENAARSSPRSPLVDQIPALIQSGVLRRAGGEIDFVRRHQSRSRCAGRAPTTWCARSSSRRRAGARADRWCDRRRGR